VHEEVVVAVFAKGLRRGITREAFGSLVPVRDAAFCVDEVDPIVEAVEQTAVEGIRGRGWLQPRGVLRGGCDVCVGVFARDRSPFLKAN
jgi:hypothetical protein